MTSGLTLELTQKPRNILFTSVSDIHAKHRDFQLLLRASDPKADFTIIIPHPYLLSSHRNVGKMVAHYIRKH